MWYYCFGFDSVIEMESVGMDENKEELKKFTTWQFINFAIGFFGLQFAWQLEIILSGPVTEKLGASPFIFGLIWLAGPITGIFVQPIIGNLSDKTRTSFGRRKPYLLGGALLGSLALCLFPNSGAIINHFNLIFGFHLPVWSALLFAALMIWIIDACVNVSQSPYRALVPDVVPKEQHGLANSYISLAVGLGSVIVAGTAPFLKHFFHYQMSIPAQFLMGALTFSLAMLWTCLTIHERQINNAEPVQNDENFFKAFVDFFKLSPQVWKIALMQFFTWIGTMCLMIYFTQYCVHILFQVPDLNAVSASVKDMYKNVATQGTNFASICFAVFNLICFLFAIPIGFLSTKFGNKKVHTTALIIMIIAFLSLAFTRNKMLVLTLMGCAGIGWASLLALPFAMLSKYIKQGCEGSSMGIFNIFIAGSQIFTCTLVAWFISNHSFMTSCGINYHWEYAFIIGAGCLTAAMLTLQAVKDA